MNEDLHLAYVNPIGQNSNDMFEYDFFFTKTLDSVWGEDWNEKCPSACEDTLPEEGTYEVVKRLKSKIPFMCAQENSCFSLQDMIDGCICCVCENIDDYDTYPTPFRLVFQFGEEYSDVENKLSERGEYFEEL